MTKKRCSSCGGSGRVMGGGMMMQDCEICDGIGKVVVQVEDDIEYLLAKDKDNYKKVKEKIKNLGMDDVEAEKVLDEEISKQKESKRK